MASSSSEGYGFFDAHVDIASSVSDARSDAGGSEAFDNSVTSSPCYELWTRSPRSVQERRSKFLDWMGVGLDRNADRNSVQGCSLGGEIDRIRENSGAVLRDSGFEDEFCSTRSMLSCCSVGNSNLLQELGSVENFVGRDGISGGDAVCDVDEVEWDGSSPSFQQPLQKEPEEPNNLVDTPRSVKKGSLSRLRVVLNEDSVNVSGASPSFQQLLQDESMEPNNLVDTPRRLKKGWLSRLRSMACVTDKQHDAERLRHDEDDKLLRYRVERVKVRQCGKRTKDLSALYTGQDIQAHEGSILTMKFSPDGWYLASAGEDGIVRVWQVLEDDRSNELDIPEIDPSCVYFTVNHLSQLKPLFVDKDKTAKLRGLRKTSDSACVIFPPKVFRLLEKPLHEFHGHKAEILDLSWSKKNHLLSASEDKTVRLWQVGCDNCLKVFSHSNYVTCVQFNPVDDNCFMTGSIDGKVRIWAIPSCQVVDWTDIRDIVTAVCYRPDGQGGIVGSMSGNCRFYGMSDSHLQLDAQICLNSKKKSPCKKITGFQFSPEDSSKVMVTCADSQVRILQGLDVIGKYKGLKNTAHQISASFTSDGRHIISACEDRNVFFWNCIGQEQPTPLQTKSVRSSERFSINASVAIPWYGFKYGNNENGWGIHVPDENLPAAVAFSSPSSFSLSQEYFLETFPKGSATWPEEKLPPSSPLSMSSALHKSQYKFLKASCQSTAGSHAWGLVIVTAGWDGRIRSFHNYGLPVPV